MSPGKGYTGVFTAPSDSLFVIFLTVRQYGHSVHGYEGQFSIKKGDTVVWKSTQTDMHGKTGEYDTA